MDTLQAVAALIHVPFLAAFFVVTLVGLAVFLRKVTKVIDDSRSVKGDYPSMIELIFRGLATDEVISARSLARWFLLSFLAALAVLIVIVVIG